MTVKARMTCETINHTRWAKTVTLKPVYSSDPADPNFSYSQATPSGSIELTITNPAAADAFVVGSTYDVDFTLYVAPEPTA